MTDRLAQRHPRKRGFRALGRTVTTVLAIAVALLLGRYALLWLDATEGDAPSGQDMHFPSTAVVTGTSEECGSGGCSTTFTLEPTAGTTTDELAVDIGDSIPGTLLDPRTVSVTVERDGDSLRVRGDYWSQEYLP